MEWEKFYTSALYKVLEKKKLLLELLLLMCSDNTLDTAKERVEFFPRKKVATPLYPSSTQPAHDVRMYGRCMGLKTLKQHHNAVCQLRN